MKLNPGLWGSFRSTGRGIAPGCAGACSRGGPDALLDHELVEYLLALALPRRDTKTLAKTPIAEFGSFGALLSADGEAIMRIGGVSEGAAAAIKIAQATALRLLKSEVLARPVLGSWQALLD